MFRVSIPIPSNLVSPDHLAGAEVRILSLFCLEQLINLRFIPYSTVSQTLSVS
jgi:hypothetical protein